MLQVKNQYSIKDLFLTPFEEIDGKNVIVRGWVRSIRKAKSLCFIVLNDGSCQKNLQIIVELATQNGDVYNQVATMLAGYCLEIEGLVVPSQGKGQAIELNGKRVTVLGAVNDEYPLQKKGTSLEFLREVGHLRSRTNTFGAVFRLRHAISYATHNYFHTNGFYYINTPIITASDCEGAGEMFQVTSLPLENIPRTEDGKSVDYQQDFFQKKAYLTVSGQLNAECLALGLGKTYTFGPTFRAEKSFTPRHLSEFWMIEPEMAFYDLDDMADLASNYLKYLIDFCFKTCPDDLAFLESQYQAGLVERLQQVLNSPVAKMTYTEAVEILVDASKKSKKFDYPVSWGIDLQTEHERFLTEEYLKGPLRVVNYPKDIKAFYMKLNDDDKTVRGMDLLVPGVGEIIGGSEREADYDKLLKRIIELKLNPKDYSWYLDLRRFGSAPHSGFGMGLERAVMYISGMSNIRDVIPFSRSPKNADF